MSQFTNNPIIKKQIDAGTNGRKKGHLFEKKLNDSINDLENAYSEINEVLKDMNINDHLFNGLPSALLLAYIKEKLNIQKIKKIKSWWTGGLATQSSGDILLDKDGKPITKCKSDIIIDFICSDYNKRIGVSVKSCNKSHPTNDQMYFTTATAFCNLLIENKIPVSSNARNALRMFCGDEGFRPKDMLSAKQLSERKSEERRFFWEELPNDAKIEWENIFNKFQNRITTILFKKAYKDDPFAPEFLLHQTHKYDNFSNVEIALFTIEEIVKASKEYGGFTLTPYKIKKGTYAHDPNIHYAPRFGFIQFQRGGQKQHPTQLQFNLKSGYFYKL